MAPVKIYFNVPKDADGYPPVAVESLWAEQVSNGNKYMIDSVPFFVGNVTTGDIVSVRTEGRDLWFEKVVRHSNNSLIRIVFFDSKRFEGVNKRLLALGCLTEYLSQYKLLAVTVPETIRIDKVQIYLREEMAVGNIDYEEPILRQ